MASGVRFFIHMEQFVIKEINEFDLGVLERINQLLNQLVSTPVDFTEEDFREILDSGSSQLFLAYVDGMIAGMLTLGTYICPTGVKYWVEDVVVDESFRGKSVGKRLIGFAIEYVHKQGKGTLMLTSKPSRVAANRLYQSVGFQLKETNVYKMQIDDSKEQ